MSKRSSIEKDPKEEVSESDVKEKMLKTDSQENKPKIGSEEGIESNVGSKEEKRIDPFKDNKRFKKLKKIISHTCLLITVLGISFYL
jgi:hypothetical protein